MQTSGFQQRVRRPEVVTGQLPHRAQAEMGVGRTELVVEIARDAQGLLEQPCRGRIVAGQLPDSG